MKRQLSRWSSKKPRWETRPSKGRELILDFFERDSVQNCTRKNESKLTWFANRTLKLGTPKDGFRSC